MVFSRLTRVSVMHALEQTKYNNKKTHMSSTLISLVHSRCENALDNVLIDVQILPVLLLPFGQLDVKVDAGRLQELVRLRRERIVAQIDQLQ